MSDPLARTIVTLARELRLANDEIARLKRDFDTLQKQAEQLHGRAQRAERQLENFRADDDRHAENEKRADDEYHGES